MTETTRSRPAPDTWAADKERMKTAATVAGAAGAGAGLAALAPKATATVKRRWHKGNVKAIRGTVKAARAKLKDAQQAAKDVLRMKPPKGQWGGWKMRTAGAALAGGAAYLMSKGAEGELRKGAAYWNTMLAPPVKKRPPGAPEQRFRRFKQLGSNRTYFRDMWKRAPGTPLSAEEIEQRREAAKARWANHIPKGDPSPADRPPAERRMRREPDWAPRQEAARARWDAYRADTKAALERGEKPRPGQIFAQREAEQAAKPRPHKPWSGERLGVSRGVKTTSWPAAPYEIDPSEVARGPGRTYTTFRPSPNKPKAMSEEEYIKVGRETLARIEEWRPRIMEDIYRTDARRAKPIMPENPDPRAVRLAWNHARQFALNDVGFQRVEGDFRFSPEARRTLRGYEDLVRDFTYRLRGRLLHDNPERWAAFREEFGTVKEGAYHRKDTTGGSKAGDQRKVLPRHSVLVKRWAEEGLQKGTYAKPMRDGALKIFRLTPSSEARVQRLAVAVRGDRAKMFAVTQSWGRSRHWSKWADRRVETLPGVRERVSENAKKNLGAKGVYRAEIGRRGPRGEPPPKGERRDYRADKQPHDFSVQARRL